MLIYKYESFTDLDTFSANDQYGNILPILDEVFCVGQTRLKEEVSLYIFNMVQKLVEINDVRCAIHFCDTTIGVFNFIEGENLKYLNPNINKVRRRDKMIKAESDTLSLKESFESPKLFLCDFGEQSAYQSINTEYFNLCVDFFEKNDIALFAVTGADLESFKTLFNNNNLYIDAIFFIDEQFPFNDSTSSLNWDVPFSFGIYILLVGINPKAKVYCAELNLNSNFDDVLFEMSQRAEEDLFHWGRFLEISQYKNNKSLKSLILAEESHRKLRNITKEFNAQSKKTLSQISLSFRLSEIEERELSFYKERNFVFFKVLNSHRKETFFQPNPVIFDNIVFGLRYLCCELDEGLILKNYAINFLNTEIGTLILQSLNINDFSEEDIKNIWFFIPDILTQQEILDSIGKVNKLKNITQNISIDLVLNPSTFKVTSENISKMIDSVGQLNDFEKIKRLINEGESKIVEFKQTFSVDIKDSSKKKYIEDSAIKTIAAFMNSDGGYLLIGVSDNGDCIGLNIEVASFYQADDKFLLHFKNTVKTRIGEEFYPFINYKLVDVDQKKILYVECARSNSPVYVDSKDFYVRTNPATDKLEGPKLLSYVRNQWP
jgi:hypothetical protein